MFLRLPFLKVGLQGSQKRNQVPIFRTKQRVARRAIAWQGVEGAPAAAAVGCGAEGHRGGGGHQQSAGAPGGERCTGSLAVGFVRGA